MSILLSIHLGLEPIISILKCTFHKSCYKINVWVFHEYTDVTITWWLSVNSWWREVFNGPRVWTLLSTVSLLVPGQPLA